MPNRDIKHLEHRSAKFAQKVKWIRAFAPQGDDQSWELILAINTLRNKVAHKLDGPERAEALQKLSNELDRSFKADGSVASNPNLDDYKIVLISSMNSIAFLVHLRTEVIR